MADNIKPVFSRIDYGDIAAIKYEQNPDTELPFVVRGENITEWPEGVKVLMRTGYTYCVMATSQGARKLEEMKQVSRIDYSIQREPFPESAECAPAA